MKVTFEFLLPEENAEYEMFANAGKLYSAVWDYAEWLRGICKHGEPSQVDAEKCRTKLYEFLNENDYKL
jgi:hypothetical protein